MRIRNNKNRRGLTLIFVVSMIVLFLLMGTTFVIISNDYFKAARKRGQAKIYTIDRTALVHRSFFKIVRGPDLLDVNSPLRGHDLLSDQYGYGFKATVNIAEPVDSTRLQLIRLELTGIRDILADAAWLDAVKKWEVDPTVPKPPKPLRPVDLDLDPTLLPGLDVPGYFGGQVLSFIDGQARGVSCRIVDYTVTEDTSVTPSVIRRSFVVVPERTPNGTNTPFDNGLITDYPVIGVNSQEIPALGVLYDGSGVPYPNHGPSTVIINGKPFSGFGAGTTDAFAADSTEAFRPNRARHVYLDGSTDWTDLFFTTYATIRNAVNEPYDAYDHDNVHLAQNLVTGKVASYNPVHLAPKHENPNGMVEENRYSFRPVYQLDASNMPLPSNTANRDFPNVANGSGTPYEMQARPFDVDNDFDGNLDSVWTDMGHSIITTRDGRRIKPMVAAMILDMDSRLNVNIHGTFADAQARAVGVPGGFMTTTNLIGANALTAADSFNIARGLGWGPAEVSLAPLLADYRALLIGTPLPDATYPFDSTFPNIPGRNGIDRFPGNSFFDFAAQWRFLDHPNQLGGTVGGSFQSRPMDIQGRFATGFPQAYETHTIPDTTNPGSTINVDVPYGMPIVDIATSTWPPVGPLSNSDAANPYPGFGYEVYNSPYEISVLKDTHRSDDELYSPDELEAMLRIFDIDSALLSSRLFDFGVATTNRHLVTTDSYEVPALPPTLFQVGVTPVNQTIPERLYGILKSNGAFPNDAFFHMRGGYSIAGPYNSANVHSLLPPEVMRGLPMNINRIFGDGRDNDRDEIVDEHWNSADPEENEAVSESYPLDANVALDHNNDGDSDFQDRFARQIFARHLFVLTWLVAGGNGNNPTPPDMDGDGAANDRDDDIPLLAQWCINVVDFRDADSICTPFKYDKNPWDGWDASPNILATDPDAYDGSDPDVGLVWGVERPELLISEALATHERRYEDVDTDMTFESRFVPKASVFVELYNPWSTSGFTEKLPAEFYGAGGIDLARHTNALSGGPAEDPVWRMVFTEARDSDPTDADSRRVYFRSPSAAVETAPDGNFYHTSETVDLIPTNGYAVIGSSGIEEAPGRYRTTFGRRTDVGPPFPTPADLKLDETRSITLIPGTGVEVVDGVDGANMTTEARSCVAIPIDTKGRDASAVTRSLGVSDPTAGYDNLVRMAVDVDPNVDGNPADGDGRQFIVTLPERADEIPGVVYPNMVPANAVFIDGVTAGARFVQLQRLANPEAPYDDKFNPYVTVDSAPVDLMSFNGLNSSAIQNGPGAGGGLPITKGDMDFDTHERGDVDNTPPRMLWPEEGLRTGMLDSFIVPADADMHFLSAEFTESFGAMNEIYRGTDASVESIPFAWFTWNNRPYVSQFELANVPLYRARDVLNNFNQNAGQVLQMNESPVKRVLDFLEVPPRFVNMEVGFVADVFDGEVPSATYASVFNPPFNYVSRYRYPGKININTLTADQASIWNLGMMPYWGVNFARLTGVRNDFTVNNDALDATSYAQDPIRPDGTASVELPRAIADPNTYDDPAGNPRNDGSLLRSGSNTNFFRSSSLPHENTTRNYWFTNSSVAKLANIATNRSSVYSIWITVGYFEVDENGLVGAEVGSDTGEVTRNRGFYIFDRSIPMAFEPGKNHNVERGILVQSIIE